MVVVGDSDFAALEFLAALSRRGVACITRLRLDAALYDPAPPRPPGTNGRPRTKGKRLPNLSEVLADPATLWRRVTVRGWYGSGERMVEISTATAVWRHDGRPIVPIRCVLVRDATQRQWSDLAIARTTRCLLGLFSLVTLLGKRLPSQARRAITTSV